MWRLPGSFFIEDLSISLIAFSRVIIIIIINITIINYCNGNNMAGFCTVFTPLVKQLALRQQPELDETNFFIG